MRGLLVGMAHDVREYLGEPVEPLLISCWVIFGNGFA